MIQYDTPKEVGGKWVVTVTDLDKPDQQRVESFDTERAAYRFTRSKRPKVKIPGGYEIFELTDEERAFVDANEGQEHMWLTRQTFKDDELDGRSMEGKSIKQYLAGKGIVVKPSKVTRGKFDLTNGQKQYIENSYQTQGLMEMVRNLWPDQVIKPGSAEARAVSDHARSIDEEAFDMWERPVESSRYKHPSTLDSLIGRVNDCVSKPGDWQGRLYDKAKLKPSDSKNLHALMGHMRSKPFFYQASGYSKFVDRDLFEANFIRWVHEKAGELSAVEVQQYIGAAAKHVQCAKLERTIEALEARMQESFLSPDIDGTKGRLSMSLVEMISTSRKELGAYNTQLKTLLNSLEGERAARLKDRHDRNASLTGLIDAVIREDSRLDLVALGREEKAEDKAEVGRIKRMTDSLGLISGFSEEEAGA